MSELRVRGSLDIYDSTHQVELFDTFGLVALGVSPLTPRSLPQRF